ncbi:hypothetical protein THOM_3028 [Trachipleistophora hominis]|uniref:Uncharacterized protein n=1 Tax=Trachipleistophora hominis TaxID=72359 RepID=L7JSQ2_TRAHO|nr:hypothetical protein THOM_3028 [Trachipleistophora hominis]
MDDKELEWFINMNRRSWCYDQLTRESLRNGKLRMKDRKNTSQKVDEIVADKMRQERRAIPWKKRNG